MTENHPRHNHTDSQSTNYSEDVNSATALLGSGTSFEERRYADVELERFTSRQRTPVDDTNARVASKKEDYEPGDDSAYASSENGGDEDEQDGLLDAPRLSLRRTHSHASTLADDIEPPPPPSSTKEKPVSWSQLPRKGQLTILTLARLSEPLTQTSLQSYMFYQLKSFPNPDGSTPSDSTVARQAGILAAAFTGAQFTTAMLWGRAADSEMFGRKRVILIGLLGTAIGSLGFGFSSSFAAAVFWRCAGGMLNGNIGVMRTMISEMIREKKYQSRAFLLLPMTFNIGVIIGPLLGGLLADPVGSYPGIFGPGGSVGGKAGVWWMTTWPYALPNVVNAVFLTTSALALEFGLEETHEILKDKPDYGVRFRKWIFRTVFRIKPKQGYVPITGHANRARDEDMETGASAAAARNGEPKIRRKLPFHRIWTRNVLCTLLSHGLLAMHVGTFSNLWFVFLSTPRYDPSYHEHRSADAAPSEPLQNVPPGYQQKLPFVFTGGLALPPPSIGTALAILGVIGISLQLLLYPRLSFKLGTTNSLRLSLLLFPLSYFLAPYLAIIHSTTPPPGQATGPWVWIGITLVLCIQVMARTFALPASAILVNNANPHPSVLGTLHGIAQSVSSATRTVGPVLAGWIYGVGLEKGIVGMAWWVMSGIAVLGAIAGRFVWEGDGHEIWLEGEKEEEDGKS